MEALAGSLQPSPAEYRELGRRAHSLKNAAGSFGLADLALAARRLEQACDHADVAAVMPAAAGLRVAGDAEMPDLIELIARTSAAADVQE
jgi:HPt (histidine-containing phosphotransfer) domain-containing protein